MSVDWRPFMRLALAVARKGYGNTGPNPLVGAVVVKDGEVVSTGYHARVGGPHAEVNALAAAGERARGADLVVTLEPCTSFGRTPPCTDAILRAGLGRVVAGCPDPNPREMGRGIALLRDHGVEVITGVEEEACKAANEQYFKFITTGRPFVTLKLACSMDGRIATAAGQAKWLSSPESLRLVHRMRREANAVLVGASTAALDNPSLTVRLVRPKTHPLRVLVSSKLDLPENLSLFEAQAADPTLVFTTDAAPDEAKARLVARGVAVEVVGPDASGKVDLEQVVVRLGALGAARLLVEGGGGLAGAFIERELADRVVLFHAPLVLGSTGRPSFGLVRDLPLEAIPRFRVESIRRLGADCVVSYRKATAGKQEWST
jgi:diaminohydroxyphosphoribosylaminopyrimidine deaminase/5-amino-6-(5-phosphoribosylamino)uracil reductase